MTYLEIEAFLAVIEHGTLTQAADHIFISQPALSKRISLLEEELGFRLIERQKGSRSITLTEKGKAFVPIAGRYKDIWLETEQLKRHTARERFVIYSSDGPHLYFLSQVYKIMYLGIVFVVVILLLALRRPLYQAILGGLLATAALYRIPPGAIAQRTLAVFTDWSSLSVLLSLYLITLLQRILEARSQIRLAQQDLAGIFHDRRIDTVGAAFFIGLLPSAASMLLCADIVKEATDGYLDPKEQAFVTSWFRHIPESVLPTYTAVLLMLNLSGVETSQFILGMIVPVIVLMFLGYQTYLRRIPAETGTAKSQDRLADAIHLIGHLWPLLLILVLILVFHMQVVTSVLLSILLSLWAYKIRREELKRCLRSAFEAKMLVNTFLVLALKEFIDYTGVLLLLPDAMAGLPLPTYLIFGLLFFVATVISGSTGAIAMATPLAFASIPQGAPLMVYLMCMSHAASQISPTHVCLVVAADYFHVSLGDLVKKTLPIALAFCVLMTLYYQLLSSLLPLG